jgi:ribosomal protein S18 acetylase RimI-like enzyme
VSTTTIRPGRGTDVEAVAQVCRATACGGDPQPPDTPDPDLVALVYARPYLTLAPDTARVLLRDGVVVGYAVGAVQSAAFYERWRDEWAPRHLPRPAGADPALVALLAHPESALPPGLEAYPSHLHMNLMPSVRGGGWGSRLLDDVVHGLAAAGSPGVHVRVDAENRAALRFYARAGFVPLLGDGTITMVRRLTAAGG